MFLCLVNDRVLPTDPSDLAARTPNRLRAAGTAYRNPSRPHRTHRTRRMNRPTFLTAHSRLRRPSLLACQPVLSIPEDCESRSR
jgi:hypothetical protein